MPAHEHENTLDAIDAVESAIRGAISLVEHGSGASTSASGSTPPPSLEHELNGGPNELIGRYYAEVLTEGLDLPDDAQILDLGCGYGRVALALLPRLTGQQRYIGLDPHGEAISWAQTNIGAFHSRARFERIDLVSGVYNPDGVIRGQDYEFPFEDGSLDLVYMISVLTHVDLPTVATYIREAARTLKPGTGRLAATYFLLDGEVDDLIAAGGGAYYSFPHAAGESRVENVAEPEAAIAHPRARVLEMLAEAGFSRVHVREGHWSGRTGGYPIDFQDLVIADFTPPAAPGRVEATPLRMDDGERTSIREVASALVAQGVVAREDVVAALLGAISLTLNALWWEDAGFTLAVADAEVGTDADVGVRGLGLDLTAARALGLGEAAPNDASTGAAASLGEAEVTALLLGLGSRATRAALTTLVVDATRNADRVREVQRSAGSLVLQRDGEPDRAVELP